MNQLIKEIVQIHQAIKSDPNSPIGIYNLLNDFLSDRLDQLEKEVLGK